MRCSDLQYDIDYDLIVDSIVNSEARRVVIQLPDGLKQYSHNIYKCIEGRLPRWVDVYIHADPNYGACDLQYGQLWATLKPDLIIHIGHSPYPKELAHPGLEPRGSGLKVVYVPALSRTKISEEMISEAARLLKQHGVKRAAITTTSQHVHMIKQVAVMLRKYGIEPVVPRGIKPYFHDAQIIGCDYRLPYSSKAEGFLYIGGGVFHPLGLYLATLKPVVKTDPYEGKSVDLTSDGEKLYRSRLYTVMKAMDADNWGVIVGLKTGQYRPWLVERLKKQIIEAGKNYMLIASENLTRESLTSIDSDWYDAFIVTSCPRLPTDDYWDYHKPVLTPGEAFMALKRVLEPYRFPW
ncbi:MAG: diphthamide biosynthesis enzyme Dph2 [Desulfurococcales archaeon]|nr:diphthamide biosynthesis enzyme Dph2 [Desulfurococcales archaeon]